MLVINLIGIGVLCIFLMFILSKKKKVLSDYNLILIILFFTGILFTPTLMENWLSKEAYLIILFINTFFFPILVTYGLLLLNDKNHFKKQWVWVFSYPLLFYLLITVHVLFVGDFNSKENVTDLMKNPQNYFLGLYLMQYLYVIAVLLWLVKKLNRYSSKIKSYYSSIEDINLNWSRRFVLAFLGLSCIGFIAFLSFVAGVIDNIEIGFAIEYLVFVLLLFYLCYSGIKQYSLASIQQSTRYTINLKESNKEKAYKKYGSSSLSDDDINTIFLEIKELFESEKTYLEPQLKIDAIAKRLNTTTNRISQIINTKSDKPFYDFVNTYRVEHFKKLLVNPENRKYTILAMGIESGFNSKASLNRIFKEHVGKSPKQFQKSALT